MLSITRGHRWIIFTQATGPIPVTAMVLPTLIRLGLAIHHGTTPMDITGFIHLGTTPTATTRIGDPIGGIARPMGPAINLSMVVGIFAMPAMVANGVVVRVMVKRMCQAWTAMLVMTRTHRFPVMFPRRQQGTQVTRVW